MFKLALLSALFALAIAAPKPGYLAPIAYNYPTAVSHTSLVQTHPQPLVKTYVAPVPLVTTKYIAAPIVKNVGLWNGYDHGYSNYYGW